MTNHPVPPVETLSVLPIELPHSPGKISVHGLNQQMVVVGHLTVRMHHPIESPTDTIKYLQPGDPVLIVTVVIFPSITTGSNMMKRASVFQSKGSCHGGNLTFDTLEFYIPYPELGKIVGH
jgi:hypothetical protein